MEPSHQALTCFVIGPIGNRHAAAGSAERHTYEEAIQVLEEVIEPACSAVGLAPVRADGVSRAGEITDQVFRRLRKDDVVVADLTGANANVMYELGLRHTCNKLTIQIGEYGRLPFDINVIRTIQFSRSANGLISAREQLQQMLEAGVAGEYDPVTATRVWHEDALETRVDGPTSDARSGGSAPAEPSGGAPGFLDLLAEGEDAQERLTPATHEISTSLEVLGKLAEEGAAKAVKSDAQGRGMKGRLALAVEFASGLTNIADDLENSVESYVDAMDPVVKANLALTQRLEEDPSQLQDAMEWALMARRLAETSRESLSELSGLAESMRENAKLARVLRTPTERILDSLNSFAAATAALDEVDRRLQGLGVPLPDPEWEPAFNDKPPVISD